MAFERIGPLDDLPERNVMPGGPLPSQIHIGNTSTTGGGQAFVGINNGSIQYPGTEDPQGAFQDKVNSCRNALFLTDPYIDRESLISTKGKRTIGTCEWIRDNDIYQSWLKGGTQLLWISGGPGKGKTVLSIFLTEELERLCQGSEDTKLLFYFCNYQDEKRNSAVAILRGWMHQLLTKFPNLATNVLPYFENPEEVKLTISSVHALWPIFRKLIQDPNLGRVFCVLDGLDECDDESSRELVTKFIHFFSPETLDQTNSGFRLAIVSRPEIARLNTFPRIKLDPDNDGLVNVDIERFISARVGELSSIEGFNDKLSVHVQDTLLAQSEGTFLWVGFVMDELSRKTTCTEIQETLKTIPKGLDAIFGRMLLKIKSNQRQATALILRWVTFAIRPLTLQELVAAAGIRPSYLVSAEQAARDEITLCGPFLKVHEDEITFVHQSAKEYLLKIDRDSYPEFWTKPEEVHLELSRTCIDVIESSTLQHKSLDSAYSEDDMCWEQESPLLHYAIFHWPEHARCSSTYAKELLNRSRPFLKHKSRTRKNWSKTYYREQDGLYMLLHLASYFGIVPWVNHLLKKKIWGLRLYGRVNAKDRRGRTALALAAERGQTVVVQLLLNHGADADANNPFQALARAAENGHKEIVQLLLDHGADVNAEGPFLNIKALSWAAGNGHVEIVQLLLDYGADVNANLALLWAAENGHAEVIQLLLDHGADVNADSALLWAAEDGHKGVVQLLLDHGANVSADLALLWAARNGHVEIVQLLLDHGADVNADLALLWAAENGHAEVVQLLLDHCADVNADSALSGAAENGHAEVVQLLLDHNNNAIANGNEALA